MTPILSPNTQAILLLTAPLIAGRTGSESELLTPGEYKKLARHLRDLQKQPADLVSTDAAELLQQCQSVIETERLKRLLGRGFLLSQVIERWQARAIWVVSRADAEYPRRLKARLREDAPAVIYGCGDITLLDSGGLAVVGSRHVDETLVSYTIAVGSLAARSHRTIVSGGAKGIDQAAMRGALESGGIVCGVLADSLEKTSMNREHRNLLLEGQMVLISPYDPNAGFNVGNAMQRNKLIYALADASLVVSSDLKKGGTWAGAVEQLDKLRFVPVYVRSSGESQVGLEALKTKGALSWPNPQDRDDFEAVFEVTSSPAQALPEVEQSLFSAVPSKPVTTEPQVMSVPESTPELGDNLYMSPANQVETIISDNPPPIASAKLDSNKTAPSYELFAVVRELVKSILLIAKDDAEVAEALNVSKAQATAWLKRLKEEGVIEKKGKLYIKQPDLFG